MDAVVLRYSRTENGNGGGRGAGGGAPIGGGSDRLLVRDAGRMRFVRADAVRWLEADGNYVRVHLGDESLRMRGSLAAATARLGRDRFVRIHRSAAVNLDHVAEICPWFSGDCVVVLVDGTRLRMSRTYRKELESRFGLA